MTNASAQSQNTHPLQAILAKIPAGTPLLAEVLEIENFEYEPQNISDEPDAIAAQFDAWRHADVMPMAPLLMIAPDQSSVSLMAAALGAIRSPLKFHNHHHTREVAYLAMLLGRRLPLDGRRELFVAACIHDLGHDGLGNRRGARHSQLRLERRALELAQPYMRAAALSDTSWQRISVMVLATDVSKDAKEAVSPAEWLRRALKKGDSKGCPQELLPLFSDPSLALQAALLEDADLGTSAGLPYDHASRMTALIADETGVLAPTPQTLIVFLDHICHGEFLTREALELFGDNISALRARAIDETADTIYNWS